MLRSTKLITISLMPEMLKEADKIAKAENRTRSELVREALRGYMAERKWREVSRYGQVKAKELGIKNEEDVAAILDRYRKEKLNKC